MDEKNIKLMNAAALAYIGDAVYEVDVRKHLLEKGISNVHRLQTMSVGYVSAPAQAKAVRELNDELDDEELSIVKRARNHKVHTKAKNADIVTYKWATAFEALMGYLYLTGNRSRYDELICRAFEILERKENE